MLNTIAGSPGQFVSSNFELVSGGQVFKDADDSYSGANPAWRTSYMDNIVARGYLPGSNASTVAAVDNDVTDTKVAAMKAQAPRTGVYMNEGDRNDPDYAPDLYGAHWKRLSAIKQAYDPSAVFYRPTCVGGELWKEQPNGTLCRI